MAVLHFGNATILATILKAGISNGDVGYVDLNGYTRKMVYNSSATNATDIVNHPYYQRPDDYGAGPGVWVEDVGAEQPQAWNAGQVITGQLDSTNLAATAGSRYDLDNSFFQLGGTDVDADGSAAGIFMGLDSGAYKLFVGDANSHIKWSGTAFSIKMASGETFDLYGSMKIYGGGDLVFTGHDSDPGQIQWEGSSYDATMYLNTVGDTFYFTPKTDNVTDLYIGSDYYFGAASDKYWNDIYVWSRKVIDLQVHSVDNHVAHVKAHSPSSAYAEAYLNTSYDGSMSTIVGCVSYETYAKVTIGVQSKYVTFYNDRIEVPDNHILGLGAAKGRIEFDDQATDEINFLDCNVGIGTTGPNNKLDVVGTLEVGTDSRGLLMYSSTADNFILHTYTNTPNPNLWIGYGNGSGGQDTSKEYISMNAGKFMLMNGNLGIATTAPGQILDVNSGSGNMIADGYDTHCLADYKEDIQEVTEDLLTAFQAIKVHKYKRKPYVSADELAKKAKAIFNIPEEIEILDAFDDIEIEEEVETGTIIEYEVQDGEVVEVEKPIKEKVKTGKYKKVLKTNILFDGKTGEFYDTNTQWMQAFPDDDYRGGKLMTCPDAEIKAYIDQEADKLRAKRRKEAKWKTERVGLIADDESLAAVPQLIARNDDGEISGICLSEQVGLIHAVVKQLVAEVELYGRIKNE